MSKCEHIIMVCQVCGGEYDNDFSPPLMCHDGLDDWSVRIEQRESCHTHRKYDGKQEHEESYRNLALQEEG